MATQDLTFIVQVKLNAICTMRVPQKLIVSAKETIIDVNAKTVTMEVDSFV